MRRSNVCLGKDDGGLCLFGLFDLCFDGARMSCDQLLDSRGKQEEALGGKGCGRRLDHGQELSDGLRYGRIVWNFS